MVKYNLNVFKYKRLGLAIRIVSVLWLSFICLSVCVYSIRGMITMAVILAILVIYYYTVLKDSIYYDNAITLSEEDLIRIEKMRKNFSEDKA
jgi:hypothetical protein